MDDLDPASAPPRAGASAFERRAASLGRGTVWGLFALALVVAPLVFSSNLAITMLSQMGIAIIACLSYNMLLGQGGMVSFGHAVYTGLGSYVAIHALNALAAGGLPLTVSLVPLVGGVAGMAFAVVLGFVTTRRSGTTFAMITLGMAELVFAMALMFPAFFGGEAGVSGNRVVGDAVWGISYGPARQVYYLVAVYTFVCVAAMFAFTRTPLGRMLNAVRDNAERVAFIGYNPRHVRYFGFIIAGFFAGISGGLAVLVFEIVTAEVVGVVRSGGYLLFTFLGGTTLFFGPIIGGVLMVLALVLLSELTQAWLLYLGVVFLLMVMYAPGGIASLVMLNLRVASFGKLRPLWLPYFTLAGAMAILLAGSGALIEMVYHLQLGGARDSGVRFMGVALDSRGPSSWAGATFVLGAGIALFEAARRRFAHAWSAVQAEIDAQVRSRSGA